MRGLVIGKFMPPHHGHLHLIDTALAETSELTVLVCSLERDPIPGRLRYEWMRALVPAAHVVQVTDENPSEPHEHPAFWDIWVSTIRRAAPGRIDVVFTSERYGDELARRLGARHRPVDPGRVRIPVSGTLIRERPHAYWAHIPAIVRPYFVQRVVLTGSESTGKTTLARHLADVYDTVWSPEYARGYLDAKSTPLTESDIEPIARGQIEVEDAAVRAAGRIAFLDTDLVSTAIYARHYYGTCPPWIEQAARERRAALYLLLHPDIPWVGDPQRDRPHLRDHMHELFRAKLREIGATWVDVTGPWDARMHQARAAIDALLA